MAAVQLKFLVHTQEERTQKQKELLLSEARSHARRVTHKKNRTQKLPPPLIKAKSQEYDSPTQATGSTASYTTGSDDGATTPLSRFDSLTVVRTRSSELVDKVYVDTSSIDVAFAGSPERDAESSLASSSPVPSPWQWSDGFRSDPFNCIPWAKDYPAEADFCMC
jgi:hypothetical protein